MKTFKEILEAGGYPRGYSEIGKIHKDEEGRWVTHVDIPSSSFARHSERRPWKVVDMQVSGAEEKPTVTSMDIEDIKSDTVLCPVCVGKGKIEDRVCSKCNGEGRVKKEPLPPKDRLAALIDDCTDDGLPGLCRLFEIPYYESRNIIKTLIMNKVSKWDDQAVIGAVKRLREYMIPKECGKSTGTKGISVSGKTRGPRSPYSSGPCYTISAKR